MLCMLFCTLLCMLFCVLPCILPCVLSCMLPCILEEVGGLRLLSARVIRYVLELRALRVVDAGSCAACAGGREGRAVCGVSAVMCCVLLVSGRCVMYGWRRWRVGSVCWRCWRC